MNSEYNKIKSRKQVKDTQLTLDYLFDEFEKKKPKKIKVNCPFCNAAESTKAFSYNSGENKNFLSIAELRKIINRISENKL